MAHRPDDVVASRPRLGPEQEIPGAEAEAAAVGQQIPDRELAGDPRVVHPEFRQVVDDPVIPVELALVNQDAERGRGEGLGQRRDLKDGVGVHRVGLPNFPHTVPLGVDQLAVFHYPDGDPRSLERLHGSLRQYVELLGSRLLSWSGHGKQQTDQHQPTQDSPRIMNPAHDSSVPFSSSSPRF